MRVTNRRGSTAHSRGANVADGVALRRTAQGRQDVVGKIPGRPGEPAGIRWRWASRIHGT
jgi:hypothetical protein